MVNEQKYLKREYCCNDSGFHDHSMKKPPESGFWKLAAPLELKLETKNPLWLVWLNIPFDYWRPPLSDVIANEFREICRTTADHLHTHISKFLLNLWLEHLQEENRCSGGGMGGVY